MVQAIDPQVIAENVRKGYWYREPLVGHIRKMAAMHAEKAAVISGEQSLTYPQLLVRIEALARALAHAGIRKGDRVVVQLPNDIDFPVVHFALSEIGAVTVPVHPALRQRDLLHIVSTVQAVAAITERNIRGFDHAAMFRAIQADAPHLERVWVVDAEPAPGTGSLAHLVEQSAGAAPAPGAPDPNDLLMIMFTSGTTGKPKGAAHTHNTLAYTTFVDGRLMGFQPADSVVTPATFAHLLGLVIGLYVPLFHGGTAILQRAYNAGHTLELAERHRATIACGPPALLIDILNHPDRRARDLSSIRTFLYAGALCPIEVIRQAYAELGLHVTTNYGATEIATATMTRAEDPLEVVSQTVGRPIPGTEVRVVDDRGGHLPPGAAGEVQVRGPSLCLGYFGDPETTRASRSSDGWHCTGDLGAFDHAGNLRIVGRKKDMINRGGEGIDPREIEEILYRHPDVLHCAVVGMPDPRLGERVCAYLQMKPGSQPLDLEQVRSHVEQFGVARFKLPERVEVVDALPMTVTGKIQKAILRRQIAAKLAGQPATEGS